MFSWLRHRRRRRWLAESFPDPWLGILDRHVKQARRLPPNVAAIWQQRTQVFVRATTWEGCRGFEITDEVRVTIAGHACLLALGFEDEWFESVRHVLVHPTPYQGRRAPIGVDGVDYSHGDWLKQIEDDIEDEHLGEAWISGGTVGIHTVILVWSEIPTAEHITPPGQNVVLHEFAHVLHEQATSWFSTARDERGEPWLEALAAEFARQVRDSDHARRTLLDDYAAESPEEFFCVATECFYERPERMRSQCPTLYALLRQFYRLDPAAWRS